MQWECEQGEVRVRGGALAMVRSGGGRPGRARALSEEVKSWEGRGQCLGVGEWGV